MTVLNRHNKIVFIHIPKTAGSAISTWMIGNKSQWFRKESYNAKHWTQKQIRRALGAKANDHTYVTCIRNPYARFVSGYTYHSKKGALPEDMTFEQFVRGEWSRKFGCVTKHQVEYFDPNTTHVMRHETLETDMQWLRDRMQREGAVYDLPRKNVSTKTDWRAFYTEETREIVTNYCHEDLHQLGYTW